MLTVARFKAVEALTSFTLLVIADETTGLCTGPSLLVVCPCRWYMVTVWDCISDTETLIIMYNTAASY